MTTFKTLMNTSELMDYREFDREAKPAPLIPFVQTYNVDEVTNYFTANEMSELEVSIIGNKALLTDGNHRIVAAMRLKMATVPVAVTYFESEEELKTVFYPQTIARFKEVK